MAATGAVANTNNKKVIFKNCPSFTACISKINNIQVDNTKGINAAMPIYNLIEHSDNYFKISGSFGQYN